MAELVLNGEYRLHEKIGEGFFAEVFRASHPLLGDRAAKVLKPKTEAPSRFYHYDLSRREIVLNELETLRKVQGKNVVIIHDAGYDEEKGLYLIEELMERNLDQTERPMREPEAREIFAHIARGLGTIHLHGCIHRDLKPSNILLRNAVSGLEVKISDFGIATLAEKAHMPWRGTSAYLAPEQLRGEAPCPASDVFAAGIIMYELLQGEHPLLSEAERKRTIMEFSREERLRLFLSRIMRGFPPRIPGGSKELERVIRRCLRPDSGERYCDGSELAEAIDSIGHTSMLKRRAVLYAAGAAAACMLASSPAIVSSFAPQEYRGRIASAREIRYQRFADGVHERIALLDNMQGDTARFREGLDGISKTLGPSMVEHKFLKLMRRIKVSDFSPWAVQDNKTQYELSSFYAVRGEWPSYLWTAYNTMNDTEPIAAGEILSSAKAWTIRLAMIDLNDSRISPGKFMLPCLTAYDNTGEREYLAIAAQAAKNCMLRYHADMHFFQNTGLIGKSDDCSNESRLRTANEYLPFLLGVLERREPFLQNSLLDDRELERIAAAVRATLGTVARNHIRDDNTFCERAVIDPRTKKKVREERQFGGDSYTLDSVLAIGLLLRSDAVLHTAYGALAERAMDAVLASVPREQASQEKIMILPFLPHHDYVAALKDYRKGLVPTSVQDGAAAVALAETLHQLALRSTGDRADSYRAAGDKVFFAVTKHLLTLDAGQEAWLTRGCAMIGNGYEHGATISQETGYLRQVHERMKRKKEKDGN